MDQFNSVSLTFISVKIHTFLIWVLESEFIDKLLFKVISLPYAMPPFVSIHILN